MKKDNFAIMRFQKLKINDQSKKIGKFESKKTGVFRALKHNLRIDNLSHTNGKINNFIIGGDKLDVILNNIDLHVADNVKHIKRDNVVSLEFVFSLSTPEGVNLDEWTKENINYLNEKFGADNVHSVVLHLDETTPHLHCIITPIENGKFNAKKWTAGKKMISEMQDEYSKKMERFGLKRGIKNNILTAKNKNKRDAKFYKMIKAAEKKLKEQTITDNFNSKLNNFNFELKPDFIEKIEDQKIFSREGARKYKLKITEVVKKEYEQQLEQFKNQLIEDNKKTLNALAEYKTALDIYKEKNEEERKLLQSINDDLTAEVQKQVKEKAKILQTQIDDFKSVEIEKIKLAEEKKTKNKIESLDNKLKEERNEKERYKENWEYVCERLDDTEAELNLYKTLDKEEIKQLRQIPPDQIIKFIKNNYNVENANFENLGSLKGFDLVKEIFNCSMNDAIKVLQIIKNESQTYNYNNNNQNQLRM